LPHDLDDAVCLLLAKDPDERPANAQVLQRLFDGIRAKMERRDQLTVVTASKETTRAEHGAVAGHDNPGPATLMSQLIRQELDPNKNIGPLGRFFNHPVVLVVLFLACVGLIVWGFLPPSAESLFARGQQLMASPDPDDWEEAWDRYFNRLERDFPDSPFAARLEEYRQQLEEHRAQTLEVKPGAKLSPAEAFYLRGQRLLKEDDPLSAQLVWSNLVIAFDGVPREQRWVKLARQQLAALEGKLPSDKEQEAAIRAALDKPDGARRRQALEFLFRDQPALLDKIRKN
ncbi:MAG: hypothetical protein AB7K24_28245, partial [Gemmataceae bacterium]